jgi:hypothetical protein
MQSMMCWKIQFAQGRFHLYYHLAIPLPILLFLIILSPITPFEAHTVVPTAQVSKPVSNAIIPAGNWIDTNGNSLQAHGASIIQVGKLYYWFGENRIQNNWLFSEKGPDRPAIKAIEYKISNLDLQNTIQAA